MSEILEINGKFYKEIKPSTHGKVTKSGRKYWYPKSSKHFPLLPTLEVGQSFSISAAKCYEHKNLIPLLAKGLQRKFTVRKTSGIGKSGKGIYTITRVS